MESSSSSSSSGGRDLSTRDRRWFTFGERQGHVYIQVKQAVMVPTPDSMVSSEARWELKMADYTLPPEAKGRVFTFDEDF